MYGFIYEWTNTVNGKKYIGSHAGTIDDGYIGSGVLFQKAIKKYGLENFNRVILEIVEVESREFLLSREKFYLDQNNAVNDKNYYNVAKDIIGGNTKAGWSESRRKEFSDQIKNIWAKRTELEKSEILQKCHQGRDKWFSSEEGKKFKEEQKLRIERNRNKINESIRKRSAVDRSKSAKLGKERMGEFRRKEAAKKAVLNRDPETELLARKKAKISRQNWSKEKKQEVFNKMSIGRKGKCRGSANGRARKVFAQGLLFDTFNDAMKYCNVSEGTLRKRLKDPYNNEYYYL